MKCRVVNSQSVLAEKRFDGSYHNADVNVYDGIIRAHSDHNLSWYCSSIFTSGRAKRAYTKVQFGLPFLSNADVSSQNPLATCKYSSKKYGYDESAILKGGMILTGRVGAIGQTSFVPKYWERYQMMGSDNIIRIVVKPENKNGFIYAYLASKFGNLSFWKLAQQATNKSYNLLANDSMPVFIYLKANYTTPISRRNINGSHYLKKLISLAQIYSKDVM